MTDELEHPPLFSSYLRYYISEEHDIESRAKSVVAFCRRVHFDGVMLFTGSHERDPWVILDRERYVRRAEGLGQAARILRKAGLAVEINVISTLGHGDPGIPPGMRKLPFQTMVNFDGAESRGIPCPLDPDYIRLIVDFFAEMVRYVRPEIIWADDDFRLTNHMPAIDMGCFCPRHLSKLASSIGLDTLTLEEERSLLADSNPDSVKNRKAYAEVMEETMANVVRRIRSAISKIDPVVRFGIMTSNPGIDRLTGKPYRRLSRAAAGDQTRPIIRPHLSAYRDGERRFLPLALDTTLWTAQVAGEDVEKVSEIDGHWPHGRYHRSTATIINATVAATFCGISRHSFFLYGFLDRPFTEDPEYGTALRRHRPMFERLAEMVAACGPLEGIRLWYDDDASVFHRTGVTDGGGSFTVSRQWIERLALLGLPVGYGATGPAILAGDDGYAVTKRELEAQLKHGVLIEAKAAEALLDRGYGKLIGLKGMQPIGSLITTEILDVGEFAGSHHGRKIVVGPELTPREHFYELLPVNGAQPVSTLLELDRNPAGPGILIYENPRGGRAAVLAYGREGDAGPVVYTNHGRREQLRCVFEWLNRRPLPVVVEQTPDLWVLFRRSADRRKMLIMIWNGSFDPVRSFSLVLGDATPGPWRISRLIPSGRVRPLGAHIVDELRVPVPIISPIDPQETAIFAFECDR